jgi:hypothetical protein
MDDLFFAVIRRYAGIWLNQRNWEKAGYVASLVSIRLVLGSKKRIGSYPILFSVVAGTGLEPVSAAADMSPPGEC